MTALLTDHTMKKRRLLGGDESASNRRTTRPPRVRVNPYAACVVRFGHEGHVHLYLNAAIPTGHHPSEGICKECGHAYSHMIGYRYKQCVECDGDAIAEMAQRLESAGINLGWGFSEQTRDYERESHRMGKVTHHIVSEV